MLRNTEVIRFIHYGWSLTPKAIDKLKHRLGWYVRQQGKERKRIDKLMKRIMDTSDPIKALKYGRAISRHEQKIEALQVKHGTLGMCL